MFDYRDLALALPADHPVYAFGLPGRDGSAPFPTVEQIAKTYVAKVRELQPNGPYHLCGHSFGGLAVYEMAGVLMAEGQEIALLALLDTEHPAYSKTLTLTQRASYYWSYISDRFGKYAHYLMRGRVDRFAYDAILFGYFHAKRGAWRMMRLVFGGVGCDVPSIIRSDALILAAAWQRYRPQSYAGQVVLFSASDRASEYRAESTLGWKTCAATVALHVVPGDHLSMLHPPCVQILAAELMTYLGAHRGQGASAQVDV